MNQVRRLLCFTLLFLLISPVSFAETDTGDTNGTIIEEGETEEDMMVDIPENFSERERQSLESVIKNLQKNDLAVPKCFPGERHDPTGLQRAFCLLINRSKKTGRNADRRSYRRANEYKDIARMSRKSGRSIAARARNKDAREIQNVFLGKAKDAREVQRQLDKDRKNFLKKRQQRRYHEYGPRVEELKDEGPAKAKLHEGRDKRRGRLGINQEKPKRRTQTLKQKRLQDTERVQRKTQKRRAGGLSGVEERRKKNRGRLTSPRLQRGR
jgi:hypothetical protein